MSLTILHPGVQTLLVDAGRAKSRRFGIPIGGAADPVAWQLANAAVGNAPDALALEFTMLGPRIRFAEAITVMVLGAPFAMESDSDQLREVGRSYTTKPGETLRIGGTLTGLRGYLAIRGGFSGPTLMGSQSSWQPLTARDQLQCQPGVSNLLAFPFTSTSISDEPLRVLPGPQRDWFGEEFFQREYLISPASNRMGLRLLGEPISRKPGELVSEPVAPGAIQITNDGLPIVLGVDGQTIGGYPKVAHLISADLPKLGQLRPGQAIRFREVTLADAQQAWREQQAWLHGWLTRLRLANS